MTWQIQEAKAKFSEVLAKAQTEGPQTITRHGKEIAVIVPIDKYRALTVAEESIWSFSRRFAGAGDNLAIERRKDLPRKVDL
jgi:antitoxin Phd